MYQQKIKLCKCGCGRSGPIWSKGMLRPCFLRKHPPKPIPRISKKQQGKIISNKQYYAKKIAENIIRNKGRCICEECGDEIKKPVGRNVAHIISAGANASLYLEPDNSNVLCMTCVVWEESGDRTTMKMYQKREEIRENLNTKYYAGNIRAAHR